jgi:hypothetical protein
MSDQKAPPAKRAFDARVENPWNEVALHKDAGFFESRRVRKRMEKLIEGVSSALNAANLELPYWPEEGGTKPAAHMRIDRTGVLTDLKKYAAGLEGTDLQQVMVSKQAETRFPNLLRHRERNSYYWPVEFAEPVWVNVDGSEPIPVGSSQGLLRELGEINTVLKVEKTFRMQKMPDFMDADEREIAKIETFMDVSGKFWMKFGFLVIRKLAERSEKTNLPIIFG